MHVTLTFVTLHKSLLVPAKFFFAGIVVARFRLGGCRARQLDGNVVVGRYPCGFEVHGAFFEHVVEVI